jgi:hypothetical protein
VAPGLVCLKREVAAFKLRAYSACPKERWPSGRRRTPGTRVGGQPSRGFESHPLRHPGSLRVVRRPKAAPLDGYARTDKFDGVAESAEQLIMHGIDGAFGWLLLIDKNSNKASMSFATADTTLSGFGTCTNK